MQAETCSFSLLGIDSWLCEVVKNLGWTDPSPIQRSTIPVALKGQDVIGIAETGSGKTGAFLLPILQHWARAGRPPGFALLLAPTRELAKQLADEVVRLSHQSDVVQESSMRVVCLVGGEDMVEQALQLAWHRHHAIIATPGRLVDHIRQTPSFPQQQLSKIRHLVLDEADRMLNMAFAEDLDTILDFFQKPPLSRSKNKKRKKRAADKLSLLDRISKTQGDHPPPNRISLSDERNRDKFAHPQTYLYSATMTKDVAKLRRAALSHDAVMVTCQPNLSGNDATAVEHAPIGKQTTNAKTGFPTKLAQYCLPVRSVDKPAVLDWLLSSTPTEVLNEAASCQVLVFCKRCQEARLVCAFLRERGHVAVPLTGRMEHAQRKQALADFLARKARILVATDVASRGLDMPNVHLVINYSVPLSEKTYRHRIGRTARAGHSGVAVTLVTRDVAHAFLELEAALSPYLPRHTNDPSEPASIPRWPISLPNPSGKHGMVARRRLADEAWSKAGKAVRAQDAESRRNQARNRNNPSDVDSSDSAAEDVDLDSTDSEASSTAESQDREDTEPSKPTTQNIKTSSELTTSGLAGIQAARQTWRSLAKEKRKRNRERYAAREIQREIASKGWGLRVLDSSSTQVDDDDDGADGGVDTDHLRFDETLKTKYAKLHSLSKPAAARF